jgi:hypothetical protein
MWHAWERREKCKRFWWENPKKSDHSDDQGVDGRMGSEWVLGILVRSVGWIQLARDRGKWRVLVNTAMNLRFLMPRS